MRTAAVVAAVFMTVLSAAPAMAGARALGGGGGCSAPLSEEATNTVVLTLNCFGPTVAHLEPGDTVTFRNADSWDHTVTGTNLTWGSTALLGAGQFVSVRFDEPGTYPYVCIVHPGMVGAVVVGTQNGTAEVPPPSPEEPPATWPSMTAVGLLGLSIGAVVATKRTTGSAPTEDH